MFRLYDVVKPILAGDESTLGVVYAVNPVEQKIYVKWMAGGTAQVTPDEITLVPFVDGEIREKLTHLADSENVGKEASMDKEKVAEKDMSKERVSNLYLRLETFVTKFIASRPAAPISVQMLGSLQAVRKILQSKMQLRGREAVLAFAQACKMHFNMGSLPLATLGKKYGNNLIRDMLDGYVTANAKENKTVDQKKTAMSLLKLAKRLLSVEFDTQKELDKYKKTHDVKPGTKLTVKRAPKTDDLKKIVDEYATPDRWESKEDQNKALDGVEKSFKKRKDITRQQRVELKRYIKEKRQKTAMALLKLAKSLLAAPIREGDVCKVNMSKVDVSDLGTGHHKRILRKTIKDGDGKVFVERVYAGNSMAEVTSYDNPASQWLGAVSVNVEALTKVASAVR